jgi:AcrR family transcriptional regulator
VASRKAGIGAKMELAALELYAERGSLKMTAAEIAARAGTTERTFFRHFPDKLDAFFGDESRLRAHVADVMQACPVDLSALAVALTGLAALAAAFDANRDSIRRRAAIVAAHPELQAREMARTAPWTEHIRQALLRRGSPAGEAALAAPIALAAFRIAYEQWLAEPQGPGFDQRLREILPGITRSVTRAQREFG